MDNEVYEDQYLIEVEAIRKRLEIAAKLGQAKVRTDLLNDLYWQVYRQSKKLQTQIVCLAKLEKILQNLPVKTEKAEEVTKMKQQTEQIYYRHVRAMDILVMPD